MIAIQSQGTGRDLVLLPGWAMHRAMWGDLPQRLREYARLHICEPEQVLQPDRLVEYCSSMFGEEVDVLGWSLGALFALQWAWQRPAQVRRLILFAGTPSFVTREGWPYGTSPAMLAAFAKALRADAPSLLQTFLRRCATGDSQASYEALSQLFERRPAPTPEVLRSGLDCLAECDVREGLRQIAQPALLIHGERDIVTPVAASRRLAVELSQGRCMSIPHCGHAPHLSRPEEVAEAVKAFLHE